MESICENALNTVNSTNGEAKEEVLEKKNDLHFDFSTSVCAQYGCRQRNNCIQIETRLCICCCKQHLKETLTILNTESNKVGLTGNADKTKYMIVSANERRRLGTDSIDSRYENMKDMKMSGVSYTLAPNLIVPTN